MSTYVLFSRPTSNLSLGVLRLDTNRSDSNANQRSEFMEENCYCLLHAGGGYNDELICFLQITSTFFFFVVDFAGKM